MALQNLTLLVIVDAAHGDLRTTVDAIAATVLEVPFELLVAVNGGTADPALFEGRPFGATFLTSPNVVSPPIFLNSVIAHVKGDVVTILPAGIAPERWWHRGVFELMQRPEVGVVAPRVLDDAGVRVVMAGLAAADGTIVPRYGDFERDAMPVLEPSALFLASLDGLSIRRDTLERVGAFEGAFARSLFDLDWVLRARSQDIAVAYRPDVTMRGGRMPAIGRTTEERDDARFFIERWGATLAPHVRAERFIP
jgi:hypothetical protein